MNEKQKNQAMVNAFGTGKPPVATMRRQGVDPNSDISALFGGMQQLRTRVHKGMSGMPLNPDGTDPGNSFDRFMRQNPHLQGETKQQQQASGQGIDPNSDINAIFSGMQQLRISLSANTLMQNQWTTMQIFLCKVIVVNKTGVFLP